MAEFRHIITWPLAAVSLVSVFYSIGALMVFLSSPNQIQIQYVVLSNLLDDWSRFETALLPITIDAILIISFILVHSLMRSSIIKSFWSKLGLASSERCIYNLSTAAAILVRFFYFLKNTLTFAIEIIKITDLFQTVFGK